MVCACAEAAASRTRRQTKRQRARIPAESTPDGRLDISGTWTGLGKPARRITFHISVREGKKVPREETPASAARMTPPEWGHTFAVLKPVRAKMVTRPEDYRWSSYQATAGLESAPDW